MYRFFRILFLASVLLPVAAAAERVYQVEVLVFQNLVRNDQGEVWPVDHTPDDAEDAGGTGDLPPLGSQPGVVWVSGDELKLSPYKYALKRSAGYRPLAYYAWRQPVQDRNLAHAFSLPPTGTESTAPWVDGSVRVSLGRYLHLDLDLRLHSESRLQESSFGGSGAPVFRLTEKRRMRSKELHYFDHPRFGVIALITPVETE